MDPTGTQYSTPEIACIGFLVYAFMLPKFLHFIHWAVRLVILTVIFWAIITYASPQIPGFAIILITLGVILIIGVHRFNDPLKELLKAIDGNGTGSTSSSWASFAKMFGDSKSSSSSSGPISAATAATVKDLVTKTEASEEYKKQGVILMDKEIAEKQAVANGLAAQIKTIPDGELKLALSNVLKAEENELARLKDAKVEVKEGRKDVKDALRQLVATVNIQPGQPGQPGQQPSSSKPANGNYRPPRTVNGSDYKKHEQALKAIKSVEQFNKFKAAHPEVAFQSS